MNETTTGCSVGKRRTGIFLGALVGGQAEDLGTDFGGPVSTVLRRWGDFGGSSRPKAHGSLLAMHRGGIHGSTRGRRLRPRWTGAGHSRAAVPEARWHFGRVSLADFAPAVGG